jgi:hypothetical protein
MWWRAVLLSHFSESPRVQKKTELFLNSSPASTQGALRLLSVPSGRFWQQTAIYPLSLCALIVEHWARAQAVRRINPTNGLLCVLFCCYLRCSTLIFMLFCVLFVCKCVLYYCQRVSTQLQLANIYYILIYWRWKWKTDSISTANVLYDRHRTLL